MYPSLIPKPLIGLVSLMGFEISSSHSENIYYFCITQLYSLVAAFLLQILLLENKTKDDQSLTALLFSYICKRIGEKYKVAHLCGNPN